MALRPAKTLLASRAWQHLFDFIIATANERNAVLGRHGLTPNDSRALFALAEERTMGALAEAWGCDASNATWLVDRLEKKGLAERRSLEGDRRVKLVRLTEKGRRLRATLRRAVYKPPRALLELAPEDLVALERATRKLRLSRDTLSPR
jgi:DNA-binding MarR family transcriptional regulator